MPLIVETGIGVRNANSYTDMVFANTYLHDRGKTGTKLTEGSLIAATDYIEKRYSARFRGERMFMFEAVAAKATITFAGNLTNGNTLTIGDTTYTFRTTASANTDIGIKATIAETATEAAKIITASENRYVASATAQNVGGATLALTTAVPGASGRLTPLSGTLAGVNTIPKFAGGLDGGSQPLSFPRKNLRDAQGILIVGIPLLLKQAQVEYACRAVSADLLPDPGSGISSPVGVIRRREQVGPIVEEVEYSASAAHSPRSFTIQNPYPAADDLLLPFLKRAGNRVIR